MHIELPSIMTFYKKDNVDTTKKPDNTNYVKKTNLISGKTAMST